MGHTIFILGTDPQQCKELREILQNRVADTIVTSAGTDIPSIKETDTVIITSEERNTGVLYRRLLNKLEEQVQRARFLGELIRLFSSAHQPDQILEKVAAKSTEVLGDTSFIILSNDNDQLRLDAAHSRIPESLAKMLMTVINVSPQGLPFETFRGVIEGRSPCLINNLQGMDLQPDIRAVVDKYGLTSLIATPIQTKDYVLGAFVTIAHAPREFGEEDLILAGELSDFTAIALENASLFAELQRSAITDPLTGLYNTRFFNEVLNREVARAERYTLALSLLMIDVDGFKEVNDSHGHLIGNKVLTEIGKCLEAAVRNTDFVFRCGGDEFGIILPQTSTDGAVSAAQKVLQKVAAGEILAKLGYSGAVTVSVGVAEYRRGTHYEALVAEADQALYAAKRSARNCVRTFGV